MNKIKLISLAAATSLLFASCTSYNQASAGWTGAAVGSHIGYLAGYHHHGYYGHGSLLGSLIGAGVGAAVGVSIENSIERNAERRAAERAQRYEQNRQNRQANQRYEQNPPTQSEKTYGTDDWQTEGGKTNR